MPFFAIAIPVLHSSGAWIASTAASSYIAGTLSSTWIGAFVLGNSSLLSSLGLVSVAGIFGATGSMASGVAVSVGSALTAVGLGGVASTLGIAPAATLLGLTPVGWAIAGTVATLAGTLGFYFTRGTMQRLNEERENGGLEPIKLAQIIKEVRLLESQSLDAILSRLGEEMGNIFLSSDKSEVTISGQVFSVNRLKYVVNRDGSEEIVFVTKTGRKKTTLIVKSAPKPDGQPA